MASLGVYTSVMFMRDWIDAYVEKWGSLPDAATAATVAAAKPPTLTAAAVPAQPVAAAKPEEPAAAVVAASGSPAQPTEAPAPSGPCSCTPGAPCRGARPPPLCLLSRHAHPRSCGARSPAHQLLPSPAPPTCCS